LVELNTLLNYKKITELKYYTEVTEVPMSNLVDFDYKDILPPPPENNSKLVQKELSIISEATKKRTKQDIEFVHKMDQDIDSFYIELLNKNKKIYPQRYINLFYEIVEPILMNTKNYWNRPRPNQLCKFYNIDINMIITDTIHTASYPSGHTVYSKLVGNILTDMYPELSSQILSIAERTGKARVQQGVHYPSDNGASFVFSNYVYDKLKNRLKQYS
jgi:hypothetical protein